MSYLQIATVLADHSRPIRRSMFDSLVEYVHAFPFKQKEHDEQLTLFTKNKGKRRVPKMWRKAGGEKGVSVGR